MVPRTPDARAARGLRVRTPLTLRAGAAALLAAAAPAVARTQPITYTIAGTADGTLNGAAFTNATLTLTFTGADASAPYNAPYLQPFQHEFTGLTEYLTLTSGASTVRGTVSTNASVFSYTGVNGAYIVAGAVGGYTAPYDLRGPFQSALDPFPNFGPPAVLPDAGLVVTALTSSTFTATVAATAVPEPSTWALLGTGLLAVGGAAARPRAARLTRVRRHR